MVSSGEGLVSLCNRELAWAGSCSWFTAELFIPGSKNHTAEMAGAEGSLCALRYLEIPLLPFLCTVLRRAVKAGRRPQPVRPRSLSQIRSSFISANPSGASLPSGLRVQQANS